MFDELEKYKSWDHFFFNKGEKLEKVCNAPKDGTGVFLVYELKDGRVELVYVGSTGKMTQTKKGISSNLLYDTLVYGKQFGEERRKSWREKLDSENIEAFDVYWYETFDEETWDLPNMVVGLIIQRFFEIHGAFPRWNKSF